MIVLKKILKWVFLSLFVVIALLYLTGTDYILKAVRVVYLNGETTASIDDHIYFENSVIKSGASNAWPKHKNYNNLYTSERLNYLHEDSRTIAYLVIKNDSLLHESYFNGYNESSKTNSFSMAKSYVCALLGKAIMDGYIESLDQPISDYFEEYKTGLASKVTVGDLASMASGSSWTESYYSPFTITTRAYYGEELEKAILSLKTVKKPGEKFVYSSGDTQLLAMIIEKATGKKLYNYLSDSLWIPLESENDALWQVDSQKNDMVKAYCCIASNAKDFARLGKLYKDYGKWNGIKILDSTYVVKSIKPRFKESPQYGYGFWLNKINTKSFFMMEGHLGQSVIVEPNDDLIIVRLGHEKYFFGENPYNGDITTYIEETYKMLGVDLY
jgi:CubicO group peptidase (beta-lactamase class C family)